MRRKLCSVNAADAGGVARGRCELVSAFIPSDRKIGRTVRRMCVYVLKLRDATSWASQDVARAVDWPCAAQYYDYGRDFWKRCFLCTNQQLESMPVFIYFCSRYMTDTVIQSKYYYDDSFSETKKKIRQTFRLFARAVQALGNTFRSKFIILSTASQKYCYSRYSR